MATKIEKNEGGKSLDFQDFLVLVGPDHYTFGRAKQDVITLLNLETDLGKIGNRNNYFQGKKKSPIYRVEGSKNPFGGERASYLGISTLSRQATYRRIYLPLKDARKVKLGGGIQADGTGNKKEITTKDTRYCYLQFPKKLEIAVISDFLGEDKELIKKLRQINGTFGFKVVGGGWHPIMNIKNDKTISDTQEKDLTNDDSGREKTTKTVESDPAKS